MHAEDAPPADGHPAPYEWEFGPGVPSRAPDGGPGPALAAQASPPRREPLAAGQLFGGRWLLVELLGRGGMGVVWRAREAESGREVALKVLGRGRLGAHQLERFRREGQLTAALQHPGIVRVHSAGELEGLPYLAYELIPGGRSLEEELGRCERGRAVALVREVALAVGHAHERGVVHRDLKPSNVLIDPAGRAKVADFGLALTSDQERMTQTGALVGTPSYMSPEQMTGRREVGPQSDVWSLGVILYQALTGRLPFDSRSFFELAAQVTEARVTPPRRVAPEVSPALEAVCLRALQADPARRYPDAGALAAELLRALSGERLEAPPLPRRGRGRLALLSGLLLVPVVAAALALRPADPAREARAELLRLLGAARREPERRAELAAALAARPAAPAALRAQGHLLLAELAEEPQERLRQAQAAAALEPGPAAARLTGLALLALERPGEALGPLREASQALPDDGEVWVALGRGLVRAGQADEAGRVATVLRQRFPGRPETEEVELLALAARQGSPEALSALEERQRRQPEPGRELVRARLLAGAGADPLPALRQAAERWPEWDPLRQALAGELFGRGELEELVVRARAWARRGAIGRELSGALAAGEELLRDPLTRPRPAVPARWRADAARWLLELGRRETAMALRPRFPVLRPRWAGTYCGPEGHVQRARARLEQLLWLLPESPLAGRAQLLLGRLAARGSQAQAEAVAGASCLLPTDPHTLLLQAELALAAEPARALELIAQAAPQEGWRQDPRAARLRGEALLGLARYDLAREALLVAWGPEQLDPELGRLLGEALRRAGPARAEEAAAVAERVARLEGSRREEAWRQLQTGRDLLKRAPVERAAAYERALELDPLCEEARFFLTKGQGSLLEYQLSLPQLLVSVSRLPYLYLMEVCEELRGISAMASGGRSNLRDALERLGDGDEEAFARAFLIATLIEFELTEPDPRQVERGLRELDGLLGRRPELTFAWALRGFLHVRAGLFAQAERDLLVARECAPETVGLYLALLAAARRAPQEEVATLLEDALRRGYPPANVEALPRYPELTPYLADVRFRERVAKLGGY